MSWFTTWFDTPYYKLLYGHHDDVEASRWVDALIDRLELIPNSEVLDMACGRGRHARLFANAGMRVTGIDLSDACIEEARSIAEQVGFYVHDMREPFARERFDLAVCLFTSLGYSSDRNDDQRTLENATTALRPGGRFVLDLMNAERVKRELVEEEHLEASGIRFHLERKLEGDDFVKHITVQDKGSVHHYTERVHGYHVDDLRAMVHRAGLRIFDLSDGPPFEAFDPQGSERLVIWAERPA